MFTQNVYLVFFSSLELVSTLRTNSLRMNNAMNDISFRQHAKGYYGNGESFSQYKTSTILDILASQRKQSHIRYSIFLMNSHLCSMHVSNSAEFLWTSNCWQLHWKTWQIYKSVNILFSAACFFLLEPISSAYSQSLQPMPTRTVSDVSLNALYTHTEKAGCTNHASDSK